MPSEVVRPSGCYGDGGWVGEAVVLRVDCAAEVPEVGCLECMRLLVLWTVCLGFQRAAGCGVDILRQARRGGH